MMRIPRKPPGSGPVTAPPGELLTWPQRLKYTFVPRKLHRWWRMQRLLLRGESELRLLPFLVDPRRNAVDVGANKGTYACFLSRLCPRVYAFEPNPAMYSILRRIVDENVTLSRKAVSNSRGPAILAVPCGRRGLSNNISTLCVHRFEGAYHPVEVDQTCLDDEPLQDVGFIKIDVEGFELEVIAGAEKLIRRDRPVLLVEIIEEHTGRPVAESVQRIEALGYRAVALTHGRLVDFRIWEQESGLERQRNFIFLPNIPAAQRQAA